MEGLYWDDGKENGNYYLGFRGQGFRFWGLGFSVEALGLARSEGMDPGSSSLMLHNTRGNFQFLLKAQNPKPKAAVASLSHSVLKPNALSLNPKP